MSSSVTKSFDEYPLLVCTNSWRDYAITVRRGIISEATARNVLRHVAPAFARVAAQMVGHFETAVGVMAVDPALDNFLAFRVYDVGKFRGRPHTIGVVGILVPRKAARGWPLSALLVSLPPPEADSDQYEIGKISLILGQRSQLPPFSKIDAWEATGAQPPLNGAVCFCQPAECCPKVAWDEPELLPHRRSVFKRILLASFVAIMAVGIAATLYILWPGQSNPPAKQRASPLVDDSRERDRLAEVLVRSNFGSEFEARTLSTEKLRIRVVAAAEQAKNNMIRLRDNIVPLEKANRPARDIAKTIKIHLEDWENPPTTPDGLPASKAQADAALDLLNLYVKLFDQAHDVVDSPDELGIRHLRQGLESAADLALHHSQ